MKNRIEKVGRSLWDFTGHSLSVSDIVALKIHGMVSSHYVDSIGFLELPEFISRENYLRNAEMAMEDDYGMIDGVINNGVREEKKSVLEQIKERTGDAPLLSSKRPKEREME